MNKAKHRQSTHKARKAKAKANHIDNFKRGYYYQNLMERNERRKRIGLPLIQIRGFARHIFK